ncbi:MAG TPA: type II toxin-antitoxin system PemK/MazF family toxin [Sphingobacteriaceae bacterium]|nr:type II toxin-antitoxin system PemK/MazF family toxin [Sphingobacteriaceae bacterium]
MNNLFIKQFEIWTADLDPSIGSEPGKLRPVVILQSDILHMAGHGSTIVCAISSQPREGVSLIRININPSLVNGLKKRSFILADQMRAVDLTRLKERVGSLEKENVQMLKESIRAILTLD